MAFDAYLQIDGIPGDTTDNGHQDWIELLSFSWGLSQHSSGVGDPAGTARAQVESFQVTKVLDKASPKLMLSCATGEHIKKVVLACRKAGGEQQDFLTVTFQDVLISGFVQGGHVNTEQEPLPSEQVTLNFDKIQVTYTPQSADGSPGPSTIADATIGPGS